MFPDIKHKIQETVKQGSKELREAEEKLLEDKLNRQ